MSLAARMKEKFRTKLARLVERRRSELGCAKAAMADVSRKIGMSVISLYRVMNNHPKAVKIESHHHAALLIHLMGLGKAAASRLRAKRHAPAIHA